MDWHKTLSSKLVGSKYWNKDLRLLLQRYSLHRLVPRCCFASARFRVGAAAETTKKSVMYRSHVIAPSSLLPNHACELFGPPTIADFSTDGPNGTAATFLSQWNRLRPPSLIAHLSSLVCPFAHLPALFRGATDASKAALWTGKHEPHRNRVALDDKVTHTLRTTRFGGLIDLLSRGGWI
jgi:hypothetical protein